MTEGNIIAGFVLIAWPLVAILFFKLLPVGRAVLANIIVAYLFLPPIPAGFDFPLLPPLNKDSIPNIMLIILCMTMTKVRMEWMPRHWIARILVLTFVFSPALTVFTNTEEVFYNDPVFITQGVWLPGLKFSEAIAICLQQALFLAPMLVARHFLANEKDQKDVLAALVLSALVYTLPALLEVRLSPQLNLWIYGYYQHFFGQSIRFGGYRPLVFLYHGIWLAFYMFTAVVAAFALYRGAKGDAKIKWGAAGVYLFIVLFLCKSAGAFAFALLLVPLVLFVPARYQFRIALIFGLFTFVYPVLKQFEVIPEERILVAIEQGSLERANSLRFRLSNEQILLDRAYEKPFFGWGSWGRNHLLDPWSGNITTVTDGRWVIVIGVFGWLGYIAEFGLLLFPLALMWWKGAHFDRVGISPLVGPLALLLGINMVDLIPNATITPMTWLLAGAFWGYAEQYKPRRRPRPAPPFQPVLQ